MMKIADIKDYKKEKLKGEITSVHDVITMLKPLRDYHTHRCKVAEKQGGQQAVFGKFPFGFWYRGQRRNWELKPKIFRESAEKKKVYDEMNITYQFQFRHPEYTTTHHSNFDWLTLMQHHGVPTRLLDWTESILMATFFAVQEVENDSGKDSTQYDGVIYILDARRLNEVSHKSGDGSIYHATCDEVEIRCLMANQRIFERLREMIISHESISQEIKDAFKKNSKAEDLLKDYCTPIAVYPNRLNDRMIIQSGVFTLHGGKQYVYTENDPIPPPKRLTEHTGEFLTYLTIPKECKKTIRDDLFALGIHEASLFPELEYQASYLKELWSFEKSDAC